jgi:signal transduction histidine kinase
MDETNPGKALHLLIHDLRAPLGVAQGYLRLLQQDRLESPDDRAKALTQAMEALGRMGRLCEDAAAYVAEEEDAAEVPVSVVEVGNLVAHVQKTCATLCVRPLPFSTNGPMGGRIRVKRIDRLAQSLAVILCAVRRSTRNDAVRVSVEEHEKEARFLLGCDEDRAALLSQPPEAFDPWSGGHGIALPHACRSVTSAGGRIWTLADVRGAIGIAVPEEASLR